MLRHAIRTNPIPELSDADVERFWDKCDIGNSCIIWTGSTNKKGYGQFKINGKNYATHRIVYAMYNGSDSLIDGMLITQLCGNHDCVNIDHLKQVTIQENRNTPKSIPQSSPSKALHGLQKYNSYALDIVTPGGGTQRDVDEVSGLISASMASSTLKLYDECINRYDEYVESKTWAYDEELLPERIAYFLKDLFVAGRSESYIGNHYKALRFKYKNLENHEGLKKEMGGIRRLTDGNKQVTGIRSNDLIQMSFWQKAQHSIEDEIDFYLLALIAFMRDGMLRPSECINARWGHLEIDSDGGASLNIPRSKTDQESIGAEVYITPATIELMMRALGSSFGVPLFQDSEYNNLSNIPGDSIWGIGHTSTIRRYISSFAKSVLDPDGKRMLRFSGYSPRVGMAQDMVANNISHEGIMKAGRWKDPRMPARYGEKVALKDGAVAQLYEKIGIKSFI